jgi:two-component system, OmpR family, sensor kinase
MSETGFARLALLVHEARSPVAAIAAIAEAYGQAGAGERRPLASLAVAACCSLERLVADAAVTSIRPVETDLAALADGAARAARLQGADVRVVGAAPTAQVDPVRVRQALDNLLANAARHAPGSPVLVEIEAEDGTVALVVSDRGPGVEPDERERIFEVGVSAGDAAGSGLGLAVARAIAVSHGGTLTVGSAPGGGAAFTLALPAEN